jgi:hypothetical protein
MAITYMIRLFVGAIEDHMGRQAPQAAEPGPPFSGLQVERSIPALRTEGGIRA